MADVKASDLNAIRTKISKVLGTGVGSYGYGQTIYSSDVSAGEKILKSHWDAVRYDIYNSLVHQTGTTGSSIAMITDNQVITDDAGDPYQNWNYWADLAQNNRFEANDLTIAGTTTASTSTSWSTSAEVTFTITFTTADNARYFFNGGGKLRITSELDAGGSPTQQSNAWKELLAAAQNEEFGGNVFNPVNFYSLTNSYQEYYQRNDSTPYSANSYKLEAKCDVANNSLGTARIVDIRVKLLDSYVDPGAPAPGDLVSGDLDITCDLVKPTGTTLQPGLTSWVAETPTLVKSSITLS